MQIEKGENNKLTTHIYVPFTKTDEEQRMVYGYCTSEAVDSQGEIVSKKAIRKAWDAYMEYGNIREMHQPSAVGVTKEYQHDDSGTWIGVKVVDNVAWEKVKEGVYKGFSIGGRVIKKSKNLIEEIVLAEISLVDRPANPDARFSAVKVDDGLVERVALEAVNTNDIAMNKYVEIDGVKFQEDPANPGQPLKGEDGTNVPFVEEAAPEADAPAAEVPAADAPVAEAPAADAPEADAPAADVPAADAGEKGAEVTTLKKFKTPTAKDSMGVITLASLLDHATYLEELFEMNGKDTAGINSAIETIKGMIAVEAGEPDTMEMSHQLGDLTKVFANELSKAVAPFMEKMGAVEESVKSIGEKVDGVTKDVELIKGTKVSPRPAGSAPVGKTFEVGDGKEAKSLTEKRAELDKVNEDINANSIAMKAAGGDSQLMAQLAQKGEELYKSFRNLQREITEITAGGAQ